MTPARRGLGRAAPRQGLRTAQMRRNPRACSRPRQSEASSCSPPLIRRRNAAIRFYTFSEVSFALFLRQDLARGKSDLDRKSTRLNSSHQIISYAVFCLKKKKQKTKRK